MKVQSGVLATALALAVVSGACTVASSNPSGTGGTSSSGTAGGAAGSSGSGTGGGSGGTGICSNGSACGGSVIGTWTVASSCLSLGSANLDITNAGLDPRSCNNVTLSGTLDVTGTWTANADGTYVDGTTTTGSAHIVLPAGCLMISGTTTTCARVGSPLSGLGFSDVTCTDAAGGGCDCTATVQQSGTPGVMSVNASASGNYTASGNMVTLDGAIQYASCVSGNMMTWTPQTTSPVTSGSVVFQKSGTTGTAGTTGSAGRGGTSGTAGTTGSAGRGGTTGTAGTSGTAGTTGSAGRGGTSGTAGTTGSAGRGGTTGTAGTTGSAGTTGTGGGTVASGPCDIYASAGTACGAAYSTIRTLRKAYTGPLYQVRNGSSAMNTGSGGVTKDIGQTSDGFADTATQDSFCNGSTCTLSILYDQSGNGNDLKAAPAGLSNGGTYAAMPDFESSATKGMLTVNGHKVYAIYMNAREGYRTPLNFMAKGVPLGNKDQGIYELADGTHSGTACCWDFGSVSPDPTKYVTMNTIFFGTGFWDKGAGSGPWFMGDFEGGVWAGGSSSTTGNTNSMNPSLKVQFALGVLHTPVGKYALRMADIKTATDLTTAYDGAIPSGKTWGNAGGLVLGVGGDNSNNSWGTFYEGAVTNGAPSNATDLAVMQNIQAAGYGK
jgi:hypothetical protein